MNPTIIDSSAARQDVFDVEDIESRITPVASFGCDRHRFKPPCPPALLLGDHSVCDPPDPISNSAVKPDSADGTNAQALEE